MYDENNIFAKILRKEIPCDKVHEDEFSLFFNDINPQAKIHVLGIPKFPCTTFSDFLKEYMGAMDTPDIAVVYFSKEAIAHKKLEDISVDQVHKAFGRQDLKVFTDSKDLQQFLKSFEWNNRNLLMMSSGNFDGIDFNCLAEDLLDS